MFKFKKKNLVYFAVVFSFSLILSSINPVLRIPLINTLKYPLIFLTLVKREIGGIIFYHRNLVQNENLKKEIDFLKQKLNAANENHLENVRLKNSLNFKQKSSFKVIAARVIARSLDSWSSVVIIDKGSDSGVKRYMPVISYLGLVGRVIDTTSTTSKIMLINDPNLSVSALVERSRQEGLISGALGAALIMKYLPKEADIKNDDAIITSGLTEAYPKGLLIGRVIDIRSELSGLMRYAVIKPAVNLSSIEEVLIIVQ
ncbi:MAG: rod shape-determining protein MreC [Omnitrophica WOR_2 bacterium RBG_13_41_10]|nr:MAG: rod shape-determining protein MreC [Omnitrophica WOR_2 bacterium RBG_13_41_10]